MIQKLYQNLSPQSQKALLTVISSNQTVYVNERCIGECRRLISAIIEVYKTQNIERYLETMDTDKKIECLDHDFLVF